MSRSHPRPGETPLRASGKRYHRAAEPQRQARCTNTVPRQVTPINRDDEGESQSIRRLVLVANTAVDNQRYALRSKEGFPLSFQELLQRSGGIGKAYYWRLETVLRVEPKIDDPIDV